MNNDTNTGVSTEKDAVSNHLEYLNAALNAFEAGFIPIPVLPGTKQTAVKWDSWSDDLSPSKIHFYWQKKPDHELAILLNDELIVYDADTPEGVAALHALEASLGLTPNLIVGTVRGEHHYFKLPKGTNAKSYAPDKLNTPERFDAKTGKAIAVFPPSTGKHYIRNEIGTVADLVEINQEQIDTINLHNGRAVIADKPERIRPPRPITESGPASDVDLSEIESLLQHLDPDMGYSDWLQILLGIYHHSDGSDEGLALADAWSSEGSKYAGPDEMEAKWRSLKIDPATPVTIASIHHMVKQTLGVERYREIRATLAPQWDLRGGDTVVTPYSAPVVVLDSDEVTTQEVVNPLVAYSLQGQSAQLMTELGNQELILGTLAMRGETTVIFAPPNAGKTLIFIWLAIQAIIRKLFDPNHLFYINADDGGAGIAAKAVIADQYGFHMLAPGHNNFKAKNLLPLLKEISKLGIAGQAIIILDTAKKFTNLMDKTDSAKFGVAIREFSAQGGTVIMLAHTNKNRDSQGKLIHAGTTDIRDDVDCSHIIDILAEKDDTRTVEFTSNKKRAGVAKKAVFQYSTADGLDYQTLLASVMEIDPAARDRLKIDLSGDATLIALVTGFIAQGINTKTALVAELAKQDSVSKNRARTLIEKYTGADPIRHRWNFTVGVRGVQTYSILPVTSPNPAPAPDAEPAPEPAETSTSEEA